MIVAETDVDAFLAAIVAAPGDPLPRVIFADWLEERGQHAEAMGQRWAARHGKYPAARKGRGVGGWYVGVVQEVRAHCKLPDSLWGIDPGMWPSGADYQIYEPIDAERWFLTVACPRATWSDDGEPLATAPPAGPPP